MNTELRKYYDLLDGGSSAEQAGKIESNYFKQVSFNDDFDVVADLGGKEPIYLKLVRNIVEISDEQELTSKELSEKLAEKGLKAGRTKTIEEKDEQLKYCHKRMTEAYNEIRNLQSTIEEKDQRIKELEDKLEAAKLVLKEISQGCDWPHSIAQNALQLLNNK